MRYLLQRGDTLGGIASRYGVSVDDLMRANPQIKDRDKIYEGRTINIPLASRFGRWLGKVLFGR